MKIKKLLLSIIAILLVVSTLSGCSVSLVKKVLQENKADEPSSEDITDIKDDGDFFEFFEEETTQREYVDINSITSVSQFKSLFEPLVDLYMYDVTEDYEGDSIGIQYTLKEEYVGQIPYKFTNDIVLGDGTKFTLPAKLGELISQGWSNKYDYAADDNSLHMKNSYGNEIDVYLKATEGSDVDINNRVVAGYYINAYENNKNIEYTVCDKLTKNSDFIEIIEYLGAPSIASYGIVDDANGKVVSITLYYFKDETMNNMANFVITCGQKNYGGDIEDWNGTQLSVISK